MKERLCRCGRPMIKEKRTITRNISDRKVTIKDVPILYCNYCQEVLYNARTVKKMDELIRKFPNENLLVYPSPLKPPNSFFNKSGLHDSFLTEADEPIKLHELAYLISLLQTKLKSVYLR